MRTNASTARASAPARLVDERRDSLHRVRRPPRARAVRDGASSTPDASSAASTSDASNSFDARSHARADVVDAAEAAARAVKTPHSGYHRRVGVERPFFEGWYFRVTLPRERQSASLIYHVYDPDLPSSRRHGAGAQVCAPGGKYLYAESPNGASGFTASAHALELALTRGGDEFFEVAREGARHRGWLTSEGEDETGPWSGGCAARSVRWDITVTPVRGWGGGVGAKMVSPAGWMTALPVFEPHWQVTMAHGLASGWIETDGDRVEFSDCPAYSEKNWGGAGFPLKWWWTQCNSFPDYPDLSITATGGNRGVVVLPNVREDVGAVGVHFGDRFFQFVPAQQVEGESPDGYGAEAVLEASAVTWDVEWGKWSVTAVGERYECSIEGACTDTDDSTVIRAPTDSLDDGMAPLCRETFAGSIVVSLWRLDARGERRETIIDAASSDTACLEIGGGPWIAPYRASAEIRAPLGPLMGLPVDVAAVAAVLSPFGDLFPGL